MSATTQRVCQPSASANNEQGFVLVMALMILVVLSIMGTAAMTVRNTEVMIATNTEIIQHNFYALEAVTLEGTAVIEETDDATLLNYNNPAWVIPADLTWLQRNDPDLPPVIDLSESGTWSGPQISPQVTSLDLPEPADPTDPNRFSIVPPGYANPPDRIQYAAVQGNLNSDNNEYDICAGSDLSDITKQEKCYSVFGMYDVNSGGGKAYSGRRMLMVGYKKTVYTNN